MDNNVQSSMLDFDNPAIRNGVLAGIGASVIGLLLYLVNARMVFSLAGWITTALFIVLMVKSVRDHRSGIEYLSFSEAIKPAFITYVVGNLIYIIFYFVLLNFIDPGLLDIQKEIAMEAMEKFGSLMGEDTFEAAMEEVENRDWGFGIGTALWTYAWGLIFPGFIICLIIAAVMKDRKPIDA
ncbi:MAG: DUF4199 domain-containing protein [Saprospiraceae bacterium]|nr:DUF4199 domain-containing protein [Saprospiraceae bacterium]